MAQQLQKKFIANDAIDGDKIKLLKDQSLEIENQAGQVVELLKLGSADEVLVKGEEVSTKAYVDQEVAAEEARALAAEGVLQSEINAEEAARISGDSNLQDAVDAEEARALAAEDVLDTAISAEQTRAIAEEARIEGKVDQEVIDRVAAVSAEQSRAEGEEAAIRSEFAAADTALHTTISAEIDADVLVEKQRAEAAETVLQSNIDAEALLRSTADSGLQSAIDAEKARIDAILSASTADSDSFAEIVNLINSVDTENDNAFSAYVLSNDAALAAEVSDRETLEGEFDAYVISNNAALAQEVLDRIADVEAEETRALAQEAAIRGEFAAADTSLHTTISAEIDADVLVEKTRAEAAEGVLQGNIDSEESARIAEDLTMLKLDGSRAMEADLAMGSFKISGLAQGVADTDAVNKAQMDAAILGSSNDLQSALDQEISDREALEGEFDAYVISNDAALASEVSARETLEGEYDAYVVSNDAALAAEVSARETLEGEYDAYVISNNAALSAEESARISADNTLQSNIDTEKARIDAILSASTADADSFKEIVDLINSVDTENDNLFSGHVTTYNAYVSANDARVLAVEGEVDVLQIEMDAVEGRASTLESEMDAVESRATAVEGRASTLESEMDAAEGRLDAIEAEAFYKEQFVLTEAQITAQEVSLSEIPQANSVVAFAGRLALHEGSSQDYEMSGSSFQFRGDIASGGVSALVAGDIITISYFK